MFSIRSGLNVAVIKVGAATEVEMKEKKARVEDVLHATRAAVEEGVVPGGGVVLVRALQTLDALKGDNHDQDVGITLAKRAKVVDLEKGLLCFLYSTTLGML